MSGHATRNPGYLLAIREATQRRWVVLVVPMALCASPWGVAEAWITTTGEVYPIGLGPGNSTVSTENVSVGNTTTGDLAVNGGSVLSITGTAPGLQMGGLRGLRTIGHGTVDIDGAGSQIDISGAGGFMAVGNWGATSTGALNITNGGSLRGTFLQVGWGDNVSDGTNGSSRAVQIDGPGSSVTLAGFGTTGLAAGGTLGRDFGNATVTLSNGASMSVTAVDATTGGPGFTLGLGGATGVFDILSGASLTIDGTGVTGGTGPGFTVGNGGTGAITVDAATLSIIANPFGGGFTIGTNGGTGSLVLDNGASLLIDGSGVTNAASGIPVALVVGREGAGDLRVSNSAALTIKANNNGGGIAVGGALSAGTLYGGTGTATFDSGARVPVIRSSSGGGRFSIGRGGGTGVMTVDGVGTSVLLDGSGNPVSLGPDANSDGTLRIQNGATFTINRDSGAWFMDVGALGHGALSISGGGKLILNGGQLSGIAVGGIPANATGGTFSILISGAGSELTIDSLDSNMQLGRNSGSSGTMTIEAGGAYSAHTLAIGRLPGSSGILHVTGPGSRMNLTADPGAWFEAGFAVGRAGNGTMTVDQGAVVTLDTTAVPLIPTRFAVGGTGVTLAGTISGGTGVLNVDGGETLIQAFGAQGGFDFGIDTICLTSPSSCNQPSTGAVTVSNGAQILMAAAHRASIGSTPGSTGSLTVSGGGSLVDGGAFLGIAKDRDGNAGGTGTLTVSAGGTVRATTINCGAGGTINGNGGILQGTLIAEEGCTIAPGSSPGTLSIEGDFINAGAKIVLEVDAYGNYDVLAVAGTATFDPSTQIEVRIDPTFQPEGGAGLQMVQVQTTATAPPPLLTVNVVESGGGTVTTAGDLQTLSQPVAVVPDITIDPTVRAVEIDIKPGTFPNVINLGRRGASRWPSSPRRPSTPSPWSPGRWPCTA